MDLLLDLNSNSLNSQGNENKMSGRKTTLKEKAEKASKQFPKEFKVLNDTLWCKLCSTTVKCDKKFHYTSHREGQKHTLAVKKLEIPLDQPKIADYSADDKDSWNYKVTKAFLDCDIPLHKMTKQPLKKLFIDIGKPLPSETKCRQTVELIHHDESANLKALINGKKIFLVSDESDIRGRKYVNTLVGLIVKPEQTFLIDSRPINESPTAQTMVTIIDDVLRANEVERSNFLLLISDAARYMVKAGKTIKILYPNCFHITCFAHLLHNCAMRVKAFYSTVDNLIACIKALTVKNKSRRDLFREIGYPPVPVVTRWGSWLDAVEYYAKNLPRIRETVENISDDGIIVRKAKESLMVETLNYDLATITKCYDQLNALIKKAEGQTYSIEKAISDSAELNFRSDPCEIKEYFENRMTQSDMLEIQKMKSKNISPADYEKLLNCQSTSASVERSFSLLNKLLAKDRNFSAENIKFYICQMYNSSTQ